MGGGGCMWPTSPLTHLALVLPGNVWRVVTTHDEPVAHRHQYCCSRTLRYTLAHASLTLPPSTSPPLVCARNTFVTCQFTFHKEPGKSVYDSCQEAKGKVCRVDMVCSDIYASACGMQWTDFRNGHTKDFYFLRILLIYLFILFFFCRKKSNVLCFSKREVSSCSLSGSLWHHKCSSQKQK